ncbi:MAG: glycosyl transferase [Massilia sp.]|jgi:UDP:flavonoid glycosyltransferase YjiC (YdhE family)|nr:glycosyl transferase [Massilia sp.]
MTRFLYAWELGNNLGHIGTFEPVARQLARDGHGVTFAVRDTRACASLLGDHFAWLQAPLYAPTAGPRAPVNYADILLCAGYRDPDLLLGLLVAWRTLLQLARPDLVFADHAPTAILAARTLGIPVMLFGAGFAVPPRRTPLPAMRAWEPMDDQSLAVYDAAALACINTVLGRLGCPALARLYELFDVAENALLTVPELDHYRARGPARYWGMAPSLTVAPGPPLAWPAGPGPRLFAYVRHDADAANAIVAAIGESGCPCIIFYPDWSMHIALPSSVTIVTAPPDLREMTRQADIGIVYGMGTIAAFLMAGKPVLCLASHLEQYLLGLRVAELGAGLALRADTETALIGSALRKLLSNGALAQRAQHFAAKYAQFGQGAVVANFCKRAHELVGQYSLQPDSSLGK